jgi:hypothetical protein
MKRRDEMGGSRGWRVTAAVGPLLSLAYGCSQVLGADDYRVSPQATGTGGQGTDGGRTDASPERGDAGGSRAVDAAPRPYLTGGECEACVHTECSSQMAACEGDAECSAWLGDVRAHRDPNSAYRRYLAESVLREAVDHDPANAPLVLAKALRECVDKNCLKSCRSGQDFECAGSFDWETSTPEHLSLRVTGPINGTPSANPWTVKACRGNDLQCDSPLGVTSTTDGFADLTFDPRGIIRQEPLSFFEFSGEPDFDPWRVTVSRPFTDGDYSSWDIPTRVLTQVWLQNLVEAGPNTTLLLVVPIDCVGNFAKEVYMRVWLTAGSGIEPCSTCVYSYADGKNQPNPNLEKFESEYRPGWVAPVPTPRKVYLSMHRFSDRQLLSIVPFNVRPGVSHIVRPFPASRRELDENRAVVEAIAARGNR